MITPAFIMCMVGVLLVGLAFESLWWRLGWAAFMFWASARHAPMITDMINSTVYLTT